MTGYAKNFMDAPEVSLAEMARRLVAYNHNYIDIFFHSGDFTTPLDKCPVARKLAAMVRDLTVPPAVPPETACWMLERRRASKFSPYAVVRTCDAQLHGILGMNLVKMLGLVGRINMPSCTINEREFGQIIVSYIRVAVIVGIARRRRVRINPSTAPPAKIKSCAFIFGMYVSGGYISAETLAALLDVKITSEN